jgi:hypothetical protein
MHLIGTNFDGSGHYAVYRDGDVLITHIGPSPDLEQAEELGRQTLIPAPEFAPDEDEWNRYGHEQHTCDIHFEGGYARIDGATYRLGLI